MKGQYLEWLLVVVFLVATTGAQQSSIAPRPATGAAFVKRKSKLYIFGGEINSGGVQAATGQFFVLDLSKPWKSDSPAWTQLVDGPPAKAPVAVMSPDDKIFMYNGPRRYHFDDRAWREFGSLFSTFPDVMPTFPVVLGTDGTVLVAGGEFGSTLTNQSYAIYSFATDTQVSTLYPATNGATDQFYPGAGYRATWSESLKSVVFFGGIPAHSNVQQTLVVTFYNAQTKKWSWKPTTNFQGTNYLNCMASSDDGNSIYLYGGFNPTANTKSFSVLNLATSAWTSLPMEIEGDHRESAVCAVAGDYFLVWGGSKAGANRAIYDGGKLTTPVSIYQISTMQWVKDYVPSAEYAAPITPSPSSPALPNPSDGPATTKDGSNTGAIVGGIAGVVVVGAIIGYLVWKRKRRGPSYQVQSSSSGDDSQDFAMKNKQEAPFQEVTVQDAPIARVAGWVPPPLPGQMADRSPHESLLISEHTAKLGWQYNPQNPGQTYELSQFNHTAATNNQYSGKSPVEGASPRSPFYSVSSSAPSTPSSSSEPPVPRMPRNPQELGYHQAALYHEMQPSSEQRGPQYIPQ